MANVRSGNVFYVDSSSSAADSSTFLTERNLKLVGIVYEVAATTDAIILYDKDSTAAKAGFQKLKLQAGVAFDSRVLRLADQPIVFPNGVWVSVTGTPACTLIFSQGST